MTISVENFIQNLPVNVISINLLLKPFNKHFKLLHFHFLVVLQFRPQQFVRFVSYNLRLLFPLNRLFRRVPFYTSIYDQIFIKFYDKVVFLVNKV